MDNSSTHKTKVIRDWYAKRAHWRRLALRRIWGKISSAASEVLTMARIADPPRHVEPALSLHALDPVVFDGIRQPAEEVIAVLHAARKGSVDLFVLGLMIDKIEHINCSARLTETLDPPKPLFESRRVPRQVNIDQRSESLQVQTLACRVGRDDNVNVAPLDCDLDVLALNRSELTVIADYFTIEPNGILPAAAPIDWSNQDYDKVKVTWREEITELERRRMEAQMLPKAPYRVRVEQARRPEEVMETVHDHVWGAVERSSRDARRIISGVS